MRYYFLLSLIPCFSYLLYKSKKAMHMLQQNWYNDGNRYLNWVIDNYNKVFIVFDLLFVLFIFFDDNTSMIIFSCFYVIAYLIHKSKVSKEQSKKPLVITPRVKRLYFTEILLFFIMIFVMFFTMYAGVVSRCISLSDYLFG